MFGFAEGRRFFISGASGSGSSGGGGGGGYSYPTAVNADSIFWSPYSAPSGSIPAYLTPFSDPETGATVTRVGDDSVFSAAGVSNEGHNYSNEACWNSNGTLIKTGGAGGTIAILNDSDYSIAYVRGTPSWCKWANTNPNLMYGISGQSVVSYDVVNNTSFQAIYTFSGSHSNITIGDGEGSPDINDTYICILTTVGGNRFINVVNLQTGSLVSSTQLAGFPDWACISPDGNYVVVSYGATGSGSTQGLKRYTKDGTNLTHLSNYTEHWDMGWDVNGDEVYVQMADSAEHSAYDCSIMMIRLADGNQQPLYIDTTATGDNSYAGVWGGHISCKNVNRKGWAYIGEAGISGEVMAKRIFAVKLDYSGDNLVEIYGSHHTNQNAGYNHQNRMSVNRDGTKIIFDSNWNDSNITPNEFAPCFILEWNQS